MKLPENFKEVAPDYIKMILPVVDRIAPPFTMLRSHNWTYTKDFVGDGLFIHTTSMPYIRCIDIPALAEFFESVLFNMESKANAVYIDNLQKNMLDTAKGHMVGMRWVEHGSSKDDFKFAKSDLNRLAGFYFMVYCICGNEFAAYTAENITHPDFQNNYQQFGHNFYLAGSGSGCGFDSDSKVSNRILEQAKNLLTNRARMLLPDAYSHGHCRSGYFKLGL